MAGVHGDEVEGVYLLKNIFDWLKERNEIEIPLIVIPILNIDGYRTGTRVNAHGVDLNRNLPSSNWEPSARQQKKYFPEKEALSEPENQFLVKLFNKFPPKFILTLHSWKPMLNYNGNDCLKYAQLMEKFNNYPTVPDIEGHPTPGSLGEYAPELFNSQVLTFEAPLLSDEITLEQIWKENELALKELFKSELM